MSTHQLSVSFSLRTVSSGHLMSTAPEGSSFVHLADALSDVPSATLMTSPQDHMKSGSSKVVSSME